MVQPHEVTVLMTVFNGAAFLEQQIDSILAQDYPYLRLTAIDDASTDASPNVLAAYAARDSRVTFLRNSTNEGLISSLGRLLRTVETEFFALADQDDIWDADKIRRSVEALGCGAELVYSDVRVCDQDGVVVCDTYLRSRNIRPHRGQDAVPFVFRNPAIGHTILSTHRVAAAAADMPPGLVFHEAWIVAVACNFGRVDFVERPMGTYRLHDTNVIGPIASGLLARGRRLARGQHAARRLRTRAMGLSAIAAFRPDLRPIASYYHLSGTRRLLKLPCFARFILRYSDVIGVRPALWEILFFALSAGIRVAPEPQLGDG
jgi:hypothetical protein